MDRIPIILKITYSKHRTCSDMDKIRSNLDQNRFLIDGYDLLFLTNQSSDNSEDIECIYPVYKGDEELLKIHKENSKLFPVPVLHILKAVLYLPKETPVKNKKNIVLEIPCRKLRPYYEISLKELYYSVLHRFVKIVFHFVYFYSYKTQLD